MVGKITDDDLDRIAGNGDKLVGILQERYGYAKEKAWEEVDVRLKELDTANREYRGAQKPPRK
jgi:uncharacterized protein YjbJ (UPF0337 family)